MITPLYDSTKIWVELIKHYVSPQINKRIRKSALKHFLWVKDLQSVAKKQICKEYVVSENFSSVKSVYILCRFLYLKHVPDIMGNIIK